MAVFECIFIVLLFFKCVKLFVNVVYIEQVLSTLFKKFIFGGVLSDVNYEYLLMMLCEIIDRIGFGLDFWNFLKILKNFFFQKSALFLNTKLFG